MRTHKRPLPGVFLVDCIEDDDGTDIMNDTEDQVCPNCGGTGRLADFRPDTDPTDNALLNPRARHSSRVGGATKLERKAETFLPPNASC